MARLGIIGGVGPPATAALYLRLNDKHRSETGRNPDIVIANLPVLVEMEQAHAYGIAEPSDWWFIAALVQQCLDTLARAGADAILLPCNTIAAMTRGLVESPVPLIDPLVATVESLDRHTSVVVLSTGVLRASRAYENALTARGNSVHRLPPEVCDAVDHLVADSVAGRATGSHPLEPVWRECAVHGATLILGCTDLTFLAGMGPESLTVVDSLTMLEEAGLAILRAE